MHIQFLGAAQSVTGSMHLLTTKHGTILLDCGMVQGRREESRQRNARLPAAAIAADVLLLSHAHIDHSGSIPTLVKSGFKGTIYATPATRDLCSYMLRDSARIQEADARYLNRKYGDDPGWKEIAPIYDEDDAIRALERFVAVPYHLPFPVLDGVRASFVDAGHILGSSEVLLEIRDGDGQRRVIFTGDLGRRGLPILRDPELPSTPPPDYVLMESTYGNRVHADIHTMHEDLLRVIEETAQRGGKLLVPAFAVGRTQEILYALSQLDGEGRLPDIPVFIDSPLSVQITEVFKMHPECYDEETRHHLENHRDIFAMKRVRYINSVEESIRLNDLRGPAVIIASSGMCEAGRILHHLKHNIEDARNTVLIVGYQAQHTLGRRIVERRPRVKIFGVERDLNARVEVMNAFSAHADRRDLVEYAHAVAAKSKRVFLVHGEPDQQDELRKTLTSDGLTVSVPALGEEMELA